MGRRSLKENQQKKIIEAFYEISKREGIENTSFGKVAKEMDMHPSLVVHYFSTREEMMLYLVDYIIDRYEHIYEVENEHINALDNLIEVLHNIFSREWNSYVDDGVFYDCFALTFRNGRVKQKFRELHALLREWLEKLIQDCVDRNLITCDDPAAAADLIFVVSDGAYYYLSMIDDTEPYEKRLNSYRRQAFKFLNLEHLINP